MEKIVGTIFIVIGLILCSSSATLFYMSYKITKEKNIEKAIKAAETRKKNKKEKEKIIKKTTDVNK